MAWRIKVSKYKNTAPKFPKKEEWITGISAGRLLHSQGNHIKASNQHIAFNVDSSGGGGIINVIPLNFKGRVDSTKAHIHAHSDYVTDFDFSPFDDGILATGSKDCTVKLWKIPDEGLSEEPLSASCCFPIHGNRVENVMWHPSAENVLAVTSTEAINIFDAFAGASKYSLSCGEDHIQSISWKGDGSLLASTNRDKKLRIHDPRLSCTLQETNCHNANKDSRVVWIGNKDFILTTGYDISRQREVKVYDIRNFTGSVGSLIVDNSTGLMMPLYDADTGMLLLPGIGDSSLRFLEIKESSPFVSMAANDVVEQVKGAALVPKLSMDVMKCEVNRILLLTKQAIIPVPYCVPRKNNIDYHGELFPDTYSAIPALSSDQWFAGNNAVVSKVSLDPSKRLPLNHHRKLGEDGDYIRAESVVDGIEKIETLPKEKAAEVVAESSPFVSHPGIVPVVKSEGSGDQTDQPGHKASSIDSAVNNNIQPVSNTVTVPRCAERAAASAPARKMEELSVVKRPAKFSKYRNTAPKLPKKEEWITGISAGRLLHSQGNHIKASNLHMAFNVDSSGGGGILGILPINFKGRADPRKIHLHAHSDYVTDFDFNPFDDGILLTGSKDCTVKLWRIPDEGLSEEPLNASHCFPVHGRRVENVLWHPCAENVFAVTTDTVKIFDATAGIDRYTLPCGEDQIQGISWKSDGQVFATTNKDKLLRVHDPRQVTVVQETGCHDSNKDSRVVWLGNKDYILTTGFSLTRQREVGIYDTRKFGGTVGHLSLDNSTGLMMPLYDADTDMLLLPGIGDSSLKFLEVTEFSPFITLAANDVVEQVKGAGLVPKLSMDVMKCEVNRILLLTKQAIVPLPYCVPRKNYIDYHSELFPDTDSGVPALTADQWFAGANKMMTKVTLDPSTRQPFKFHRGSDEPFFQKAEMDGEKPEDIPSMSPSSEEPMKFTESSVISAVTKNTSHKIEDTSSKEVDSSQSVSNTKTSLDQPRMSTSSISFTLSTDVEGKGTTYTSASDKITPAPDNDEANEGKVTDTPVSATSRSVPSDVTNVAAAAVNDKPEVMMREKQPRAPRPFTGFRQSKFRHLRGLPMGKHEHVENLRNLSSTLPGESDMFHANVDRYAVPLSGPGGLITVIESCTAGRLPSSGLPVIQNGSPVTDFVWDPFDNSRLVVGCDDSKIRIWDIPSGGLTETLTDPMFTLNGHSEKIYFVRFHPLAKDVMASASYDMAVKLWNLSTEEEMITLHGHTDTIFCLAWSPNGRFCATMCKDGQIRIYEPRKSNQPIQEGPGPDGHRGARIAWVCKGKYLVVSGFEKNSNRMVSLYDVTDLSSHINSVTRDTSPAILIPHYDEDSSTLFLTGRGDCNIFAYEISEDFPHFFELSHVQCNGSHKALSFLPKFAVNVRDVEFAKAYRLTQNSIEPFSFSVPRVKAEYFQDDIFPDTIVTWKPALSAAQWFSGVDRQPVTYSLRPADMELLSEKSVDITKAKKYNSYNPETYKTDEQRKEELVDAVMGKLTVQDQPLPQDLTEGVDEDEWDD